MARTEPLPPASIRDSGILTEKQSNEKSGSIPNSDWPDQAVSKIGQHRMSQRRSATSMTVGMRTPFFTSQRLSSKLQYLCCPNAIRMFWIGQSQAHDRPRCPGPWRCADL